MDARGIFRRCHRIDPISADDPASAAHRRRWPARHRRTTQPTAGPWGRCGPGRRHREPPGPVLARSRVWETAGPPLPVNFPTGLPSSAAMRCTTGSRGLPEPRMGCSNSRHNWDQVRGDWQEQRNDIREDWQQHRDEARDDWQNWFDDHYGWYGGWYGGHASGYWSRWDYLWDNHPVAAVTGLTWWAANSIGYQLGCSDYSNPYYAESMPANYSEPIVTQPIPASQEAAAPATSNLPPGVSPDAVAKFDQARASFFEGRYEDALKLTDEAVALMPHDAVLHEFRSLVLFALKHIPNQPRPSMPSSTLDRVGTGKPWVAFTRTLRFTPSNFGTWKRHAITTSRPPTCSFWQATTT